jgi:hypothetical protein
MVSQDISMEPTLTPNPADSDDLLTRASYFAQDLQAQCADVSAMAFPSGHIMPSEEMLCAVAFKMRSLIAGIEMELNGNVLAEVSYPQSWSLLLQSGFLREPALIDFILAQYAHDHLTKKLLVNSKTDTVDQLPAWLLTDDNRLISEAANAILTRESLLKRSPEQLYQELPVELLYQTIWRVVAALQILAGAQNEAHLLQARRQFSEHDESTSMRAAARKIVHFAQGDTQVACLNPEKAGIAIFASTLAARCGLEHDYVLRLISSNSISPFAVLLRGSGLQRDEALAAIQSVKGAELAPHEIYNFDTYYDAFTAAEANMALSAWSVNRTRQLAFPNLNENIE